MQEWELGWTRPVTHALNSATAELRYRTNRIAARRNAAEVATGSAQHPFTEGLL
jgi:hypothetical protein